MNHQLTKQTIKKWSSKASLIFTLALPLIDLTRGQLPSWKTVKNGSSCMWITIILMILLTYYCHYYTLTSIFWPTNLSLWNWLLFIPCGLISFWQLREIYKRVKQSLTTTKEF